MEAVEYCIGNEEVEKVVPYKKEAKSDEKRAATAPPHPAALELRFVLFNVRTCCSPERERSMIAPPAPFGLCAAFFDKVQFTIDDDIEPPEMAMAPP